METKLIKSGNDLALTLDKSILEIMQITLDTSLEISIKGDLLIIRPIREKILHAKLEASLEKNNGLYKEDLEKLSE